MPCTTPPARPCASTTSALTWGYYGGGMWVDGVLTAIANGTVALTGSTTNYVEATRAGVVSKNTSAFTPGSIPLYTIVTGVSTITSYTDHRVTNFQITGRLSKSVAGSGSVTLTSAEAANQVLNFTGILTGNKTVVVPNGPQVWHVFNNTTGAYTLTIKTSAGTGIDVVQTKAVTLEADGTNVVTCNTDTAALGAQPLDAELTAIAGLTSASNKLPYFTGSGTAALADFTTFGRSLVDDADAAAARTTLELSSADSVTFTNVTASSEFRGTVLTSDAASNISLKSSGGEQARILHTASAVNYVQLTGNATGGGAKFRVEGSDTNITAFLISKGTSPIRLQTNGGTEQMRVLDIASAVNFPAFAGSVAASNVQLNALGSDANIGYSIFGKGAGNIFMDPGGGSGFAVLNTVSAVNYVVALGGATGNAVTLSATGTDSNIDFKVTPKGTGQFDISGTAATTAGTPASFSANRYLAIKVNGTSYYLPLATATW